MYTVGHEEIGSQDEVKNTGSGGERQRRSTRLDGVQCSTSTVEITSSGRHFVDVVNPAKTAGGQEGRTTRRSRP